jgi:hypothetical protein
MVKPTLIYAAIGAAMLQRGRMNRYVAPDGAAGVEDWMIRFGYVWAALMLATGLANLIVAPAFTAWWPLFVAAFPLVSKLALFALQFASVCSIGRAHVLRRPAEHERPVEALPWAAFEWCAGQCQTPAGAEPQKSRLNSFTALPSRISLRVA